MKEGPLLPEEVLQHLNVKKDGFYIDGTAGMGYLSEVILNSLGAKGKLLLVDSDEEVCDILAKNEKFNESRVMLENSSYTELPAILERRKLPLGDGILFDFGIGTYQLNSQKGFSFMKDNFLDMRYSKSSILRAWDVVNSFPEKDLADILYKFGEERRSRLIAKRIIEARNINKINSSAELADIINTCVRRGKKHPATKTFQALRIFVNKELDNVEKVFSFIPEIIKAGGRAVFLTFHSLEDRIVKIALKKLHQEGKVALITKKAVKASYLQGREQPRARSVRLRAVEIL